MTPARALALVRAHARSFARTYVAVVEAMLAEGVPEDVARFEGRMAALFAATVEGDVKREPWEG